MMRCPISSLLATVLLGGLCWGQQPPAEAGESPESPPAAQSGGVPASSDAQDVPAKPSSTDCTNMDGLFADKLSQTYLVLGSIFALLLLPTFFPLLLGYRAWWLTRPVLRWLVLAGGGWLLVLGFAILIPQLVASGTLSRDFLRIPYSTIRGEYAGCLDVPLSSKGVLWGWFGDKERALIAQEGSMWLGAMVVTVAGVAVYWSGFLLLRLWNGCPAWSRNGD